MAIESFIKEEIAEQEIEKRKAEIEALKSEIIIGDEYANLKSQLGYKRLEQAILERTAGLSRRLLIVDTEKELHRLQGELLGIQSILNIVDTAIENAKQIKDELNEGINKMAEVSTIDNLPANATASEMEQAIKAHLAGQTESAAAPIVKEAIEQVTENAAEETRGNEIGTTENAPEVTEDNAFDYKKGYDGLRGWNTKLSQQVADLARRLDERQQQAQPAAAPTQQMISQDQYLEWYQRDPVAAQTWLSQVSMQPVQQRVNYLESTLNNVLANAKVAEFGSKHADFGELRQDIFGEVSKYPKEVQDNPEYYDRVLETAYYAVKGRRAVEGAEKAREQGRREAQNRAAAKANAVVEGAGATATEPVLDTEKMSSKEIFSLMQAKGIVKPS